MKSLALSAKAFIYSYRMIVFVAFLVILLLDQVSKWIAATFVPVILNDGISFGLFSGQIVILGLILVYIAFFEFSCRYWHHNYPIASGLILGGAMSNLVDRLVLGGVRDFLQVPFLGVHNNLADWGIVLGLAWIVGQEMIGSKQSHDL
jgi:lipoprotein signal peptidase